VADLRPRVSGCGVRVLEGAAMFEVRPKKIAKKRKTSSFRTLASITKGSNMDMELKVSYNLILSSCSLNDTFRPLALLSTAIRATLLKFFWKTTPQIGRK
jgi:hypothetical protein